MKIRMLSLLICLMLVVSVLAGCGSQKSADEQTAGDEQQVTTESTDTSANATTEDNSSTEIKVKGNKKIVVLKENGDDLKTKAMEKALPVFEKAGYVKGKNLEIVEINIDNDEKKGTEAVNTINQAKPDLVLVLGSSDVCLKSVVKPLEGKGIPVVLYSNCDSFVDESGKSKQNNITGIYLVPKDIQVNAFKILQQIAPLNGKKAVFLTDVGFFKKEDVESNLKKINVELKSYEETTTFEDYKDAINKYNADNEVGWILCGVYPIKLKAGGNTDFLSVAKWDIPNRKKPTCSLWEAPVEWGVLVAPGVDIPELGAQSAEMCVKVLDGEKIENLKAEYPRKTIIVVNTKSAKDMNLTIPPEILSSAAKIYDKTIADQ